MRRATGAPWFIRNVDLHSDLELPTIRQYMKRCSRSYFDSAMAHPNPLVVGAVNYTPSKVSAIWRPRHLLDKTDDYISITQERAYMARAAIIHKYHRYRPRRRSRHRQREKVINPNVATSTLPSATPQAEVRSPQELMDDVRLNLLPDWEPSVLTHS